MRVETSSDPVRLDRSQILDAAERIVGSEGAAALTLRRIGIELDTDPTAIYRHFRNKEELLTHLAARLFSTEPAIDPALSWQDQLRTLIRHNVERYRAHPDLGALLARQGDDLAPLIRTCEQVLTLLVYGAKLDLTEAATFARMFENHVAGCGLFFAISDQRDPGLTDRATMRRTYSLLPFDQYPLVRTAAADLFPDPYAMFDRTTDLLIAAVEQASAAPGREDL
jgi:AcrR family transcriptional regulator